VSGNIKLFAALVLAFVAPAMAHHNYRLNFDDSKEITLVGVVAKVSWANPHITIYLDVLGEDGETDSWALPTAAPGVAQNNGLTKETLAAGDAVVVVGWPARDETKQMRARRITLSNGNDVLLHPTGDRRGRNRDRETNDEAVTN
jgi:hypothetical protein